MKRLFYWSSFAILGFLLATFGFHVLTWQFWAVMACVVAIVLSVDH